MALGEPNLMDLDVEDLGMLEQVINTGGVQPPVAPEPAPVPPVAVPPVAPAAPVPPAPVIPPAAPVEPPPAPEPAPAVPGSGPSPEPPALPVPPAEPAPITPPVDPMARVKPRYYTRQWSPLNQLSAHIMAENPDMTPTQAEVLARQDLNMEPLQLGVPAATAPGAPAPTPTPAPAVRTTATVEAELAEIEARYRAAVEAEGGLVTSDAADLQLQHSRKAAELQHLQAQEATALATQEQQFETARQTSLQRAYAMHPDAQKPETAVGQAVAKVMADLQANDDPRLDDARAPELVLQLALLEAGVAPVAIAPVAPAPVAPPPAAPAPTPPPVAPQQRMAPPPVLPGHGSTAGGAQPTLQDLNGTLHEFFNQEDGDPFGSLLYPHLAQGQQPPRLIL